MSFWSFFLLRPRPTLLRSRPASKLRASVLQTPLKGRFIYNAAFGSMAVEAAQARAHKHSFFPPHLSLIVSQPPLTSSSAILASIASGDVTSRRAFMSRASERSASRAFVDVSSSLRKACLAACGNEKKGDEWGGEQCQRGVDVPEGDNRVRDLPECRARLPEAMLAGKRVAFGGRTEPAAGGAGCGGGTASRGPPKTEAPLPAPLAASLDFQPISARPLYQRHQQ